MRPRKGSGKTPLPRYVKPVKKKNGREYYFYMKYRGTKNAWPSLPLPPDIFGEEFALRLDQYSRLIFFNGTWNFTDREGFPHEISAPDKKNIHAFWTQLDRADIEGKKRAAYQGKTFYALIEEFKESQTFLNLAESTRKEYSRYMKEIDDAWGSEPVAALTTVDAQMAIDVYGDKLATAKQFRGCLKRLVRWGIPRGYSKDNPVDYTDRIQSGDPYSAWPDWAFETFFKYARPDMHGPVISALFTGQRSIDIFRMIRQADSSQQIEVIQVKTGKRVWINAHTEYQKHLEHFITGDSTMLHLTSEKIPWTLAGFRTAWQRTMNEPVFERFRKERIVFHGLRKCAVNLLLEAGCTEAQTGAIVGMSEEMVRLYSMDVRVKMLTKKGMTILEREWGEVRPATLPRNI